MSPTPETTLQATFRASYSPGSPPFEGWEQLALSPNRSALTPAANEHARQVGHIVDHLMMENKGSNVAFDITGWARDDGQTGLRFNFDVGASLPTSSGGIVSDTKPQQEAARLDMHDKRMKRRTSAGDR